MSMNTSSIENILKNAPQPAAPAGLRDRLYAQTRGSKPRPFAAPTSATDWLRRWWPVLAPAAVSLACASIFTLQLSEIHELKARRAAPVVTKPAVAPGISQLQAGGEQVSASATQEIQRLKALAAQLNDEVARLQQFKAQNEQLRKQLAARSAMALSPEETKAIEDARARSQSIVCVNNLKQLGLAVRMFAVDNKEQTPPNLQCLSNYIGSFMKVFVCPTDTARQAANDANSFTPANCSYEYLAPSSPDTEPNQVVLRCPIHGHIGLMDGSVQSKVAKEHPDWLVQQNGKIYFQVNSPPQDTASPGNNPNR